MWGIKNLELKEFTNTNKKITNLTDTHTLLFTIMTHGRCRCAKESPLSLIPTQKPPPEENSAHCDSNTDTRDRLERSVLSQLNLSQKCLVSQTNTFLSSFFLSLLPSVIYWLITIYQSLSYSKHSTTVHIIKASKIGEVEKHQTEVYRDRKKEERGNSKINLGKQFQQLPLFWAPLLPAPPLDNQWSKRRVLEW